MLADFLLKILKWHPKDRPTAQSLLEHPWLSMPDNYVYKMTDMEYQLFELRDQARQIDINDPDYKVQMETKANLVNHGQV